MPTFRAAFVRLLSECVRTQQDWYGSYHTQLVQALVLADRCDSYKFPCTLGICGRITLALSSSEEHYGWKDILEGVKYLCLPSSAWWGLLDLIYILTVTICQTWFTILRLALLGDLCATYNLCGIIVSMRSVKVGRRSGGDGTYASRHAFCCTGDSTDARSGTPPKHSKVWSQRQP